jgi:hypothetical protein
VSVLVVLLRLLVVVGFVNTAWALRGCLVPSLVGINVIYYYFLSLAAPIAGGSAGSNVKAYFQKQRERQRPSQQPPGCSRLDVTGIQQRRLATAQGFCEG